MPRKRSKNCNNTTNAHQEIEPTKNRSRKKTENKQSHTRRRPEADQKTTSKDVFQPERAPGIFSLPPAPPSRRARLCRLRRANAPRVARVPPEEARCFWLEAGLGNENAQLCVQVQLRRLFGNRSAIRVTSDLDPKPLQTFSKVA